MTSPLAHPIQARLRLGWGVLIWLGLLLGLDPARAAGGLVGAGRQQVIEMSYDLADRLTVETREVAGAAGPVVTAYTYDAVGNRTRKAVSGAGAGQQQAGVWDFDYNALNQLTGFEEKAADGQAPRRVVAYEYDAAGNRTRKLEHGQEVQGYAWDHRNRLVSVSGAGAGNGAAYEYDYRMRRVTRQEAGVATAVSYVGGVSAVERQGAQVLVEQVRGPDMGGGVGGLLYSVRAGQARFSLANGRGDVVAQADQSGTVTWAGSYEGFGTRTVESGTNLDRQRANTKEEDPTGLLNEGFRYRDLETGTWLSRDPAGFVDGPNLYAYVQQNPWSKFDPLGLAENDLGAALRERGQLQQSLLDPDEYASTKQRYENGRAAAGAMAEAMDTGASLMPVVGNLKDISEAGSGTNAKGEEMGLAARILAGVGGILGIKGLGKGGKAVDGLVDAGNAADNAADVTKAVTTTGELFQDGARYALPADRASVNAFNKSALAEFRASGGTIVNTKTAQDFNGRYNPVTNTIELAPGRHLDTLTEELIHFRQAQEAGIIGKSGFPGRREMWESDAMDRLQELGFTPIR